MKKTIVIETKDVCAKSIECTFDDKSQIIHEVKFNGGCSGNTQAVSKLVIGMKITDLINFLGNIKCGNKTTSCVKELCKGLARYLFKE